MSRFIRVQRNLWVFHIGITILYGGILIQSVRAQTLAIPATPALRQQGAIGDLEHDLTDIFNDPRFSNATWGVCIRSMETGEYLFRLNDTKSLLPASNFKLFTTAEALSLLSPDFRYTTQLITTGRIADGTLHGDLIIRGAGDPTLGSSLAFPDSSPSFIFNAWADSLSKHGIKRIDGSIIGDDSYFTDDLYPSGWEIEDLPYYYAMQTTALAFDENQIEVSVSPGLSKGSVVRYELEPNTDYVTVDNRGMTRQDSIVLKRRHLPDSVIATGATSIDITRDIGTNSISVRGEIPLSAPVTSEQLSVENPTLYAASVFREALEERGIEIIGKTRTARELAKPIPYLKARVLASYISPPLSDIVAIMNKHSDNLYAEELFRTVGKEIGGEGSWQRGTEVMKKYLASIEIDTGRVSINDGSGLSRMDLVTAQQMVSLLHTMRERSKLFAAFYPSLSIMGVDGTLSSRLKETRAEGNVYAKTGFLTGVRSISGYLTTRDGEMLAFSIIGNNFTVPVSQANNLQDLVLLRLVNFSRK
jgi:D-alanyl-D-alanine carboxypeptidase/D-alanyl-D-alanine-endopeptidase (penicillin-binding protein 4)